MTDFVVLVDKDDNELGTCEKIQAHKEGVLHRAFSVFVFNSQGLMLLQKRAQEKYHCPGLWTNACCSHPRLLETPIVAANRRMVEELGISCPLKKIFTFLYKADVGQGLVEHEFDHVFFGCYDGLLDCFNSSEVESVRWIDLESLQKEVQLHPESFTPWFRILLDQVIQHSVGNLIA